MIQTFAKYDEVDALASLAMGTPVLRGSFLHFKEFATSFVSIVLFLFFSVPKLECWKQLDILAREQKQLCF